MLYIHSSIVIHLAILFYSISINYIHCPDVATHSLSLFPKLYLYLSLFINRDREVRRLSLGLLVLAAAIPLCLAFSPPTNHLSRTITLHASPSPTKPTSSLLAVPDGGVVITGATGGFGYAHAAEFLDRGYDVVIWDVKDCSTAAEALSAKHPNGNIFYTECDAESCRKLGTFAKEKLGRIG